MKRRLDGSIIENLKKTDLWKKRIEMDCREGNVFLTIRNNQVDFYHKGGRLFSYDKSGFKTHLKYAAAIESSEKNYLTEKELASHKLALDFISNYSRIKENCSNYSSNEALGVSQLYKNHSYLSESKVVVIDIEVSFQSLDENNKHDRIDIVLYNYSERTLQFVEAKHYSNKEIWSTSKPKVLDQIERYEKQLQSKKQEILTEYINYVKIINAIFGVSLPEPVNIDKKITLLIFGFDDDQKNGRLKNLILSNPIYKEKKIYPKGEIKSIALENLWNAKQHIKR